MNLGVNIDHIATIREARRINDPDPLEAMFLAKSGGADQITLHLREDRRHIDEFDLKRVIESSQIPVNVECALNEDIVTIVKNLTPNRVTVVPEKREEVTTEGGLSLRGNEKLKRTLAEFQNVGISVSLFVDPTLESIDDALKLNADALEFHTGAFANYWLAINSNINRTKHKLHDKESREIVQKALENSLKEIRVCADEAKKAGFFVAAGHGLNYQNVLYIKEIAEIEELNIGHSIVARAVMVGFERAVREMKELIG